MNETRANKCRFHSGYINRCRFGVEFGVRERLNRRTK